uniref:DM14 domain-containing protein n=1 Tax=Setaria digitata TaxID=48799 RepID=A0A915Q3H4_9BILA
MGNWGGRGGDRVVEEKAMYGDVENDEELMAELLALEAEERAAGHIPDTCTDRKRNCSTRQYTLGHHESAIQGSQRMVSSYGISSVSDEDLSSDGEDIDDPELLAELSDLVGQRGNASPREVGQLASPKPPISSRFSCDTAADMTVLNKLQELKKEYSSALKTAKEKSDGLRIKRYQRGFDKIEELMQKMRAGETIDESDIPISLKAIHSLEPVAAIGGASVICKSEVAPPQSVVLLPEVRENVSEGIGEPSNTAVYQLPIKNLLKGEQLRIELVIGDKKAAYEYYVITKQFDEAIKAMNNGEVTECEENELPPMATPYRSVKYGEIPPPPPKTLLEGLQQRMQKYKALCERSKADNDDRKHRMIVRILKQYDDAIKACQANKPVNINELPCPPGYPSLPPSGNVAITTAGGPAAALSRRPLPEVGVFAAAESSVSGRQSRQKQQLDFLLKRQLQFKQAAITAKKKGDVTAAKKFLLTAKVIFTF